jgi:hypothetical protein
MEKIQARVGFVFQMNLVSNRLQPALGEEKKSTLRTSYAPELGQRFLP